jgi:hypothetical protein
MLSYLSPRMTTSSSSTSSSEHLALQAQAGQQVGCLTAPPL